MTEKKRHKEKSPNCWFILLIPKNCQETKLHLGLSDGWQEPKYLSYHLFSTSVIRKLDWKCGIAKTGTPILGMQLFHTVVEPIAL